MSMTLPMRPANVVGLGGCGTKLIDFILQNGHPLDAALAIDQAMESQDLVERGVGLRLLDGETLSEVLERGARCDPNTAVGQTLLHQLASWRPLPNQLAIPLSAGSGRLRALGRTVGLATSNDIKSRLHQLTDQSSRFVVASSTTGGNGSSLVTDVVEYLLAIRPSSTVHVVWVNAYPSAVFDSQHALNAVASVLESISTLERWPDNVAFSVVDARRSEDWRRAVSSTITDTSVSHLTSTRVLAQTLSDLSEFLSTRSSGGSTGRWLYCRSRPIIEACGLSPPERQRLMSGFLKAMCAGAIEGTATSPAIRAPSGEIQPLPLFFGGTNPEPVLLLPSILENARFLLADDRRRSGIDALMQWSDETLTTQWPRSAQQFLDPAGYNTHYPDLGVADRRFRLADGSIDAESFMRRQLELIANFQREPYTGNEGIGIDGLPVPSETPFRDIAQEYEGVVAEIIQSLAQPVVDADRQGVPVANSSPPIRRLRVRDRLARASRELKPYWGVRYALPSVLAVATMGIFLVALGAGQGRRDSWADSATIVAGVMGGFAVCLGAVAIIVSIQNSSVPTQRSDRLYASCVAVCEAVDMFEVALTKARLTPTHARDTADDWSHPSVRLAAHLLGQRLSTALEEGLFRLLTVRDIRRGTLSGRLEDSLSLQVFVVVDDLCRIDPSIFNLNGAGDSASGGTAADAKAALAPVASADSTLRLACSLRREIESLRYRDIADSMRTLRATDT